MWSQTVLALRTLTANWRLATRRRPPLLLAPLRCRLHASTYLSPPLPSPPFSSLLRCPHPRPTVESLTPLPRFTHTPLSHSPSTHPPSVGSSLSPAKTPRHSASTTRTALSLPSGPLRARQAPSLPLSPFLNVVVSLSISVLLSLFHVPASLALVGSPSTLPTRFSAAAAAAAAVR